MVLAPGSLLDRGEKAEARVVGEHLLVYTGAVIAIFDLESGEQVLDQVAAGRVVASSTARLVAFEALRRRFTPSEASSSVIEAVDVKNVAIEPVFPNHSVIRPAQFGWPRRGSRTRWTATLAGELAFSPDGEQVAFFCTHIPATPDGLQRVFLVVIDLSGLPESRFVHMPADWTASLQPDVDMGDRKPYFAVGSMAWSDRGEIVVHPPRYARWLKDEIDVELPGAEIWATEAHHSARSFRPRVPETRRHRTRSNHERSHQETSHQQQASQADSPRPARVDGAGDRGSRSRRVRQCPGLRRGTLHGECPQPDGECGLGRHLGGPRTSPRTWDRCGTG